MASIKSRSNPFDLVKASDFSDEQIDQYWVDLTGEAQLHHLFQPLLPMPMLLLGGKGSGKTHLMRYYSSSVRKIHAGNDTGRAAEVDGFLGIYVRADGLNVGRFAGKEQPDEVWAAVFSFYFELWLATHFLRIMQECFSDGKVFENEGKFARDVIGLFSHLESQNPVYTIQGLIDCFTELRKKVDHVVGNVATKRSSLSEINICVAPGDLVFGVPELLAKYADRFSEVLFVYLIDEIENFSATQQKFLNSLIRYRRGGVTFKIGCRLYGVRTKKTLDAAEEEIRQGAEYEKVELDAWLREHDDAFKLQALGLIDRRLRKAGFSVDDLRQAFVELDPRNWYQNDTLPLMERWDKRGADRPYFADFRRLLLKKVPADVATKVVEALKLPELPLIEKANIYVYLKDWEGQKGALSLAKSIREQAQNFLGNGRAAAPKYAQSVEHFKSDFLAQIFRECAGTKRASYIGLDSLVHLSQGVPRNLLGLLKHIYRRAQFAGERPFEPGVAISAKSQSDGILDAAAWFWEDAQPDKHGNEVRLSVQAVAELFSAVRYSPKPAECDLSTFTVMAGVGTDAARMVLEHAENWSYLVRVSTGAIDRNDKSVLNDKFQLSPMLAPRWGVSEHRRGTIALSDELFNAMFDPSCRAELDPLVRKRLAGMRDPLSDVDSDQGSLI